MNSFDLWTIRNPPVWASFVKYVVASGPESVTWELALPPDLTWLRFQRLLSESKAFGEPIKEVIELFRVNRETHELEYNGSAAV